MIDAIGIADEGVGDSAEIHEAIPVGIVAREPRDFEAEYNADMAESDFGSKSGKAIARHDTGSGNAKIFVDNDNLLRRPSKCGCFGGERILALRRLSIVLDLSGCGLPQIDAGSAAKMRSADLGEIIHPSSPSVRRL